SDSDDPFYKPGSRSPRRSQGSPDESAEEGEVSDGELPDGSDASSPSRESRFSVERRGIPAPPGYRIPRVDDYVGARSEVPTAPVPQEKSARVRVAMSPAVRDLFEQAAAGRIMSREDRTAYQDLLPVANSPFGLVPRIDTKLRLDKAPVTYVSEFALREHHATLLSALTCMGYALTDHEKCEGYSKAAMHLIGTCMMDTIGWRREGVMRSLNVDSGKVFPRMRVEPLKEGYSQEYR
ncbi:hypothetical protein PFISCL1PPCAC_3027, partial [Pristionchus fissidentatus]